MPYVLALFRGVAVCKGSPISGDSTSKSHSGKRSFCHLQAKLCSHVRDARLASPVATPATSKGIRNARSFWMWPTLLRHFPRAETTKAEQMLQHLHRQRNKISTRAITLDVSAASSPLSEGRDDQGGVDVATSASPTKKIPKRASRFNLKLAR